MENSEDGWKAELGVTEELERSLPAPPVLPQSEGETPDEGDPQELCSQVGELMSATFLMLQTAGESFRAAELASQLCSDAVSIARASLLAAQRSHSLARTLSHRLGLPTNSQDPDEVEEVGVNNHRFRQHRVQVRFPSTANYLPCSDSVIPEQPNHLHLNCIHFTEADDETTDEEEVRLLRRRPSLSHHRQLDTVRREETNKGGAHYITQRRRSPRRSPSGGLLSPLISGNEVSVLKPLSRSPSRQGCHGVQKVVQRRRGRERGLQENTDSDGETSAQHSTP